MKKQKRWSLKPSSIPSTSEHSIHAEVVTALRARKQLGRIARGASDSGFPPRTWDKRIKGSDADYTEAHECQSHPLSRRAKAPSRYESKPGSSLESASSISNA